MPDRSGPVGQERDIDQRHRDQRAVDPAPVVGKTMVAVGLARAARIDTRTRDLSGGEKQRVSIARAIANNPPLLLADEPTTNLDSRNGRAVMELLTDLARAQASGVVVVSHDTRLQDLVDNLLWLEDGRLRKPEATRAATM
jgi:putative ABC transport system ATP-binding protein